MRSCQKQPEPIGKSDQESSATNQPKMRTSPKEIHGSKLDLDDSSDEEFPDVADCLRPWGKKKIKKEIKTVSSVKHLQQSKMWASTIFYARALSCIYLCPRRYNYLTMDDISVQLPLTF